MLDFYVNANQTDNIQVLGINKCSIPSNIFLRNLKVSLHDPG